MQKPHVSPRVWRGSKTDSPQERVIVWLSQCSDKLLKGGWLFLSCPFYTIIKHRASFGWHHPAHLNQSHRVSCMHVHAALPVFLSSTCLGGWDCVVSVDQRVVTCQLLIILPWQMINFMHRPFCPEDPRPLLNSTSHVFGPVPDWSYFLGYFQ